MLERGTELDLSPVYVQRTVNPTPRFKNGHQEEHMRKWQFLTLIHSNDGEVKEPVN